MIEKLFGKVIVDVLNNTVTLAITKDEFTLTKAELEDLVTELGELGDKLDEKKPNQRD